MRQATASSTAIAKDGGGGAPVRVQDVVLQERVLPGVSRTFALTIPQLPEPLRRAVANAYLLCRIADTIEDDAVLSVVEKERFHGLLRGALATGDGGDRLAAELAPRLADSTSSAERELVRHAEQVLRITRSLAPGQRTAIVRCVRVMSEGMGHFERGRSRAGLATLHDLELYCYFVAGVVGEMLTELFCDHSEAVAGNRAPLLRRARLFGQGLQMTNILKDLWDDLERDTCWLPRDVFRAQGFDLRRLEPKESSPQFRAGLHRMVALANGSLREALRYTLAIPPRETGIRRFLLWAIGLAVLTLQNIHRRPSFSSGEDVKVSRRAVATVVASSNAAIRSSPALLALYRLASRGLPLEAPALPAAVAVPRPAVRAAAIPGSSSR